MRVERDVSMLNESTFKKNLIKWFNENQREMPWRETSNLIIFG